MDAAREQARGRTVKVAWGTRGPAPTEQEVPPSPVAFAGGCAPTSMPVRASCGSSSPPSSLAHDLPAASRACKRSAARSAISARTAAQLSAKVSVSSHEACVIHADEPGHVIAEAPAARSARREARFVMCSWLWDLRS